VLASDYCNGGDRHSSLVRILTRNQWKFRGWPEYIRDDPWLGLWAGSWFRTTAGLLDDLCLALAARICTALPHVPQPVPSEETPITGWIRGTLGYLAVISIRAAHPPGIRYPVLDTAICPSRAPDDGTQALRGTAWLRTILITPFIFVVAIRQGAVSTRG
jgi:hypothetical protein